jgi:hypothetical protein
VVETINNSDSIVLIRLTFSYWLTDHRPSCI